MPVFCRQGQALGLSTQGMNSALTSGAHSGANMFLQVFPFCLLAKKTSDTKLCFRKYPFSLCLYAVCRIIDCRPSSKACFSGFEWVKHHVFFFFAGADTSETFMNTVFPIASHGFSKETFQLHCCEEKPLAKQVELVESCSVTSLPLVSICLQQALGGSKTEADFHRYPDFSTHNYLSLTLHDLGF